MPLTSLWRNGDKMFSLSRNVTWSAETSRTFHAEATRTTTFTSHRNITLNKSSALSKRHIQPADLAPVFSTHNLFFIVFIVCPCLQLLLLLLHLHLSTYLIASTLRLDADHHHSLSPVIISPPPPLMKASIKCSASPEHPPGHLGYRNIWTFLNQQTAPPPPPSFSHSPPPSPHPWNHSIHWSIKCISLLRRSSSSSASYIYLPPSVLFFFPPSDYTYSSISAWLQNPPTSCRRVYRPDIYSVVKAESIQSCDCWLKGFLTFVDCHCCTEGRILSFQNFSIGRTVLVSSMGGKIKLLSKKNHETNRLSFSLPVD